MRFELVAKCSTTMARAARMHLPHGVTDVPAFMPVGTGATLKGLTYQQLESLGITLILNNTFHLSLKPGKETLDKVGGAHNFQGWRHNLLTDSGGFQMVSLLALSSITEEGVRFLSPFDGEPTLLTPEMSISLQHSIGSDIIMQLDDVVHSLTTGPRVAEAMERSVRWLDRCIKYHHDSGRSDRQNLFAIVQGGLDENLRAKCLDMMLERRDGVAGYAIGGLSGGEAKDVFTKIVRQCTERLPEDHVRYCMGIGFGEDLLVCVALGVDIADCVFPTRTARFGIALSFDGPMNLKLRRYSQDMSVIDDTCPCPACLKGKGTPRALLHMQAGKETAAAHLLSMHNLAYQARVMTGAREAIIEDRFPEYLQTYFARFFKGRPPKWAVDALRGVGVHIQGDAVEGDGAVWEYSDRPPSDIN